MNIVNSAAEFQNLFNRANIILSASVLRADMLRKKAAKIHKSKKTETWIKQMNKRDELLRIADITESRGRNVWESVTSFQGKYINWRNLTTDNQLIFDIHLNAAKNYEKNLPTAKKLAGI